MAAKLSMSFTWPLYFSKSQVNSNKMWHKFHYLNSGMTHIYYFWDFTDGVNFGQYEIMYLFKYEIPYEKPWPQIGS